MVEVSVADTGVGIAPEDQEAVFEEFLQVGTADKKAEGTGLGVALSRKFNQAPPMPWKCLINWWAVKDSNLGPAD